jgi:putative nucleotidyltransferase with HDIG domain
MTAGMKIIKKVKARLQNIDLRKSLILKICIAVVLVTVTVSLFPTGESIEYQCEVGSIWGEADVTAPFSFPIPKNELQYRRERDEAAKKVFPVFKRSDRSLESYTDTISLFFASLKNALDFQIDRIRDKKSIQVGDRKAIQSLVEDSMKLSYMISNLNVPISDIEWRAMVKIRNEERNQRRDLGSLTLDGFKQAISSVARDLLEVGILNLNRDQVGRDTVALRTSREEQLVSVNRFFDIGQTSSHLQDVLEKRYAGHVEVINPLVKIGVTLIEPNIIYDNQQTATEIKIAQDLVAPTLGVVKQGDLIVRKNDRITAEVKQRLDALRKSKTERSGDVNQALQYVGKFGHVTVVLLMYVIYLSLFRKRVFSDNYLLSLIALLILLEVFLAHITYQVQSPYPLEYLILVPIASMLLTMIFDSRLAFYGTVVIAYLVSAARGNDYSIALASFAAGGLAVYTVRDIKNRTQIFRSLVFILFGYGICIISLGLERYQSLNSVLDSLTFAGVNAVLSPILTYGLLVFFEKAFNVTSDVTLLELSSFNQPLLRELSAQAPGTFHHSMVIGSLAEAAAEAIGANSILARVGAYYHDIGKTDKSEYFVENQMGSKSKHDRLTPNMSTLIITSHVKEGIELGRKYKLPQRIIDFIPMHHGTTLISYFYQKALRKRSRKEEVREIDFRYFGPRPQTKETGIVMLADAIEAAARSIEEPTAQKLEGVIDDVTKQRFMDGQLDECDLTMRDLTKIKESFLKTLIGIHHPRIKYPSYQEGVEQVAEDRIDQRPQASPEEMKVKEIPTESAQPSKNNGLIEHIATDDGAATDTPTAPTGPESLEKRIKAIDDL